MNNRESYPFGYIYFTFCKVTEKIYIGQHKKSTFNNNYYGSGTLVLRALKAYGRENFTCKALEYCYSQEELDRQEIKYIYIFDATNPKHGMNIHHGGGSAPVMKGEDNPMFGKKHSIESRKKMSESTKGNIPWNKGLVGEYKSSDATKEKISKATAGENHPLWGKKHSEESRKLMSESAIKSRGEKVICLNTNEVFDSIKCASIKYNLDPSTITKICKGKLKTTHGYSFAYYKEVI